MNQINRQDLKVGMEDERIKKSRERFAKHLLFEPVDRPPYYETLGFWPQTIKRWEKEGLPEGMSGEEYFEMESVSWPPAMGSATALPLYPGFERKIVEDLEDYIIVRTEAGILQKEYKHGRSMPQFLEFPVCDRKDWEALKPGFDPFNEERYKEISIAAEDFNKRKSTPRNREICPLPVDGAYAFPRNLFGEVNLAYAYYDDPELMHDIMRTWLEFYCGFSTKVCSVMDFDFVYLFEDMAFNTGPLIGPEMVKEFMMPYYKELISHLKTLGLKVFILDCDGDARKILGQFVDAGVNSFMPCEINANMEPLPLQKQFGRKLSILGGVNKTALFNSRKEIYEEVMRKVPELLRHGGYVPGIDHGVSPEISLENFAYFIELVRKLGQEIKPEW